MKKGRDFGVSFWCFCLIAMLISGCATMDTSPHSSSLLPGQLFEKFEAVVDSLAAPDAASKGKNYILTSAIQGVSDNSLQFKEFARYMENALAQRGYKRVGSKEDGDLLIRMAYAIGDPKTATYTSTYTTRTGYSYPVGWMWFHVPPQTAQETIRVTNNLSTLLLVAYDQKVLDSSGGQIQLWTTTVKLTTVSSDLRIVLPFMITAAVPYFGENTSGQQVIPMTGWDKRVLDIRK